MDYSLVRQRLAEACDVVVSTPGLETYAYIPDSVSTPCFIAGEIEILDPHTTFGGSDTARITCYILTSRSDDRSGQKLLDGYLSRTGAQSIRAALAAALGAPGQMALSGAASTFVVEQINSYRFYTFAGVAYFGAQLTIKVWG